MPSRGLYRLLAVAGVAVSVGLLSCTEEFRPWWLGGTAGLEGAPGVFAGGLGTGFSEVLLRDRVFTDGRVVKTTTTAANDLDRTPLYIDFNRDGKIDPVVGYAQGDAGVVQILLSYGDPGTIQYTSLTLDGGENQWANLSDVAVGDIDGDGALDLVVATGRGVVYLHHPSDPAHTHVLAEWGQPLGSLELINGTTETLSETELQSLIATATTDAGVDPAYYVPIVKQGYTALEIADFDNDGFNDIAASRQAEIRLQPQAPDLPLDPLVIVAGSVQVLVNPGGATTGENWGAVVVGQHERHNVLDREGVTGLRACDLDGDGDLDLITAAANDQNVQVAWFENPGGPGALDPLVPWTQHRIGSLRGAVALDVADLTGDGRPDVVAVGPDQMQMVLFVQPDDGPLQGYDWYTAPVVTFESYKPHVVKALDVDENGRLELVVGGTAGAVRYFEAPLSPLDTWIGTRIATFDPPGDVGLLGYGDLDGDGDLDLISVVSVGTTGESQVTWLRNELVP